MEDHEIIDQMFGRFQTIINNLRSLGKTYDNYDSITKILQMETTSHNFQGAQRLEEASYEGTSWHPQTQKASKVSSSKGFKAEESCEEAFEEEGCNKDELSFISRKTPSMWKKNGESRWKNNSRKFTKETKDKIQVVCYECKKLGHFKFEYPSLEKGEKKPFFSRRRKSSSNCLSRTPLKLLNSFHRIQGFEKKFSKLSKEILKLKRYPYEKFGIGYNKKKNLKKEKSTSHFLNCGRFRHLSYDCRDCPNHIGLKRKDLREFGRHQPWYLDSGCSHHIDLRPKSGD
ncbi:hypothetical protein CR513_01281, partial [Mucuna pruriens]